MTLIYDEFKKIIPKETVDFFNFLLPYLRYYIGGKRALFLYYNETNDDNCKSYYLSLAALNSLKQYKAFLGENGFKESAYQLEDITTVNKESLEVLYEKYNYLIPKYEDKILYYGLQPLDIVLDLHNKHSSTINSFFNFVFTQSSVSSFRNEMKSEIDIKTQLHEKEIEKEIFNLVPITVVSYIETASKIRTLLYKKLSYNKNSICKLIDEDIIPLSLFLALFFYTDTNNNEQGQNKMDNQQALIYLLEEKGISLERIKNTLNFHIDGNVVKNTDKNIHAIKQLYSKYFASTNNMNKNLTKTSIESIIKNVLNRNFTNSLVIEKLLSMFECNVEMFKNIEQEIVKVQENRKKTLEQENIKKFYKDVPKKTRDFIEFAGKTYILILDKMSEKKHNDEILLTNNDAVVLSLFIASYFFNGKISTFFNDSGASCEKVLKLLKINLNKKEIESKKIDRDVLVKQYQRYVYGGENYKKSTNKLTIDDVCFNICNSDFTKSSLLESIFNSLIPEVDFSNNLLEIMKRYFIKKEKIEKLEKSQKLFYDIPVETIKIIEKASIVYPKLKGNKGLTKRGAQAVSLLLSILYSDNKETKEFLIDKGFNFKKISNYFELDYRYLFDSDIDINLLSKEYGLLIFGLKNKDKKREELTTFNLIRNIFTKEFNNSNVAFNKFLDNFDLSYDTFKDIDKLYQDYLEKLEREKIVQKIREDTINYHRETIFYIKSVLRIHEKLKDINQNIINEDIETISLLLGIYTCSSKTKEILMRNGLNIDNVLTSLKLPDDFFENLESIKIDFETYKHRYKKYLLKTTNPSSLYVYDVFKDIFTNNQTIKNISSLCKCNYGRLEREIHTGMKYEDTLTVCDRTHDLELIKTNNFQQDDMQTILYFGNELLTHSSYIYEQLPIFFQNNIDKTITKINDMVDDLYIVENQSEKKTGLFTKIFTTDISKCTINKNKLYELEIVVDEKLQQLKKDLLGYDSMRKYIELYIKKNKEHYEVATSVIKNLNTKLETLDSSDEDQYPEYLRVTSFLHIINDKANHFATVKLLMRKELLKINQAIMNHFITINSLEMAKCDLLPLIKSELAIAQGRKSENQALELSKNITNLFIALLNRNVDTTIENMNKIQKASIPEEIAMSINKSINTHLQEIKQVNDLEGKIKTSDSKEKILEKKTN